MSFCFIIPVGLSNLGRFPIKSAIPNYSTPTFKVICGRRLPCHQTAIIVGGLPSLTAKLMTDVTRIFFAVEQGIEREINV